MLKPLQASQPPVQAVLLQEQKPMTAEEIKILQNIRNKKLLLIAGTYFVLLAILMLAWMKGPSGGGRFSPRRATEDEIRRFKSVAPIVISFCFVILTIYFVNYYLKSLHPYIKDLKAGFKELIYFEPGSYKTPFFETYYIQTISQKNALVRVSKEMYDAIQPGCKACIALSPSARFVFFIDVDGKKMEFNEKNSIIER